MTESDAQSHSTADMRSIASHDLSPNNFDLIRLVAAGQVALFHGLTHMAPSSPDEVAFGGLELIPGVPVFFFVSGFLISRAFEQSRGIAVYARNRFLRLYPALFVCVILSTVMVAGLGFFSTISWTWIELAGWLAAQLTFLQFYNPEMLRTFGVGALNGSLWTISVEIQFYLFIPVLYAGLARLRDSRSRSLLLVVLIVCFIGINRWYIGNLRGGEAEIFSKLLGVSLAPWLYMFLMGVLMQWHLDKVRALVAGKFLGWVVIYIAACLVSEFVLDAPAGNSIGPFLYLVLIMVILSAAYSDPVLSERALRRNDISYGLYIWHMPIINALLWLGWTRGWLSVVLALGLSVLLAVLSWFCIERPALRRKKRSLYGH
ncbi:MAG: acyltransferase [Gammaproteobacteria bacterium]|nr:acyltransferase [Gammaproteobacteria bacterium]